MVTCLQRKYYLISEVYTCQIILMVLILSLFGQMFKKELEEMFWDHIRCEKCQENLILMLKIEKSNN